MVTTWTARTKPTTTWWKRPEVSTDWDGRIRPITYMTPLQDAYTLVADENDEVIYILANEWKLIPATFRKKRKSI